MTVPAAAAAWLWAPSHSTHLHTRSTQHNQLGGEGEGADAGRSGAARAVPYASRLVLEAWGPRRGGNGGGGVGRIRLAYNGRVLATLEGGLGEWRARYAAALAVRSASGSSFMLCFDQDRSTLVIRQSVVAHTNTPFTHHTHIIHIHRQEEVCALETAAPPPAAEEL